MALFYNYTIMHCKSVKDKVHCQARKHKIKTWWVPIRGQQLNKYNVKFQKKHLQTNYPEKRLCKTIIHLTWTHWFTCLSLHSPGVLSFNTADNILDKSTLNIFQQLFINFRHKYFILTHPDKHSVTSTFSCHTVPSAGLHNYLTDSRIFIFSSITLEQLPHPSKQGSFWTMWHFIFCPWSYLSVA